MKNLEIYLEDIDFLEKHDPEKYIFFKEIANKMTDIELAVLIKNIFNGIEKNKREYLEITNETKREIFVKEKIELYTYASFELKVYKTYSKNAHKKYKNVFLEELEYWKKELEKQITKEDITQRHENVFSNNGFILFNHILNNYVRPKDKRGRFSDIGFYYWKMYNSEIQYIHQKPEVFKKWFLDNYENEDIGKIKTLTNLKNASRNIHYTTALEWFKHQNK